MATIPPSEFEEIPLGPVKSSMTAAGATTSSIWQVPVNKIKVIEDFNVRVPTKALEDSITHLQGLISAEGFKQSKPLEVVVLGNGTIAVTDGHKRLEAVLRHNKVKGAVKIEKLPCVTVPAGSTTPDIMKTLVVSNSGAPLSALETGIVIARLVKFGQTTAEIAKSLDITKKYAEDLLRLVEAPSAVKSMVIAGTVAPTTAIKAIIEHGTEAARILKGGVETAAAAGRTRATPKDTRAAVAASPARPSGREKLSFSFKRGQKGVTYTDVEILQSIPGDWMEVDPVSDAVKILRGIKVVVSLGAPKTDAVEEV